MYQTIVTFTLFFYKLINASYIIKNKGTPVLSCTVFFSSLPTPLTNCLYCHTMSMMHTNKHKISSQIARVKQKFIQTRLTPFLSGQLLILQPPTRFH